MVIARIGQWEWPSEWGTLVQDLVTCLKSTDKNLMKGAITVQNPVLLSLFQCLDMFADGENLSDENLPSLLKILLPELWAIFSNTVSNLFLSTNFTVIW